MNPDLADLLSILAALVTALLAAAGAFVTSRRARADRPQLQPLEVLLQQLTTNAVEAGRLASLVQTEIQAKLFQVSKLQREASEAEQLAALHGAAAEAVAAQFKAAVASESRKSARRALLSNFLFFAAGVAASIFVTLLVRPIGS